MSAYDDFERTELGRIEFPSGRKLIFYEARVPFFGPGGIPTEPFSTQFEFCISPANGKNHRQFIRPAQISKLADAIALYQARQGGKE